jgi:hypothetical protein
MGCGEIVYSSQSSSGCFQDKERELCVTIRAEKDSILADEVLPLTITVTSNQDEQELRLFVTTAGYADFMKRVQFPSQELMYEDNFTKIWEFDIKGNQTITFNGSVTFSGVTSFDGKNGLFEILVFVGDLYYDQLASNSLQVNFTEDNGYVYHSGTPLPTSTDITPIVIETYPYSTYTPGPSPTWAPSATWYPEITTREALTQQAAKTPQPEQTAKP